MSSEPTELEHDASRHADGAPMIGPHVHRLGAPRRLLHRRGGSRTGGGDLGVLGGVVVLLAAAAVVVPRWMTAWVMLVVLAGTVLTRHPDPLDWHPYLLVAGVHAAARARILDARNVTARTRPVARAGTVGPPVRCDPGSVAAAHRCHSVARLGYGFARGSSRDRGRRRGGPRFSLARPPRSTPA